MAYLPYANSGIIYIATGLSYLKEAIANLERSIPYLEGLPSCLITDIIDPELTSLLIM